MHQLEQLVHQFKAHLCAETERIERLKEFSAALEINGSSSSFQVSQASQLNYPCHDEQTNGVDIERHVSKIQEEQIEKPPLQEDRNLWSSLGQYQVKRDELIKERKQEYQEYLRQQQVDNQPRGYARKIERENVVRICKDRNELDEERRKLNEIKYRGELKEQIEENRARKGRETRNEIRAQRQDELRLQRELLEVFPYYNKEKPIKAVEVVPIEESSDRIRSPSYRHVKEPRMVSTPIKLRPLLEAFSRSCSDITACNDKGAKKLSPKGPVMASLSQVRSKMMLDHKELIDKLQSDLSIS